MTAFVILGSLLSFGCLAGTVYAFQELNKAAGIVHTLPEKMDEIISAPTVIKSMDGQELFSISAAFRKPVPFEDIPKVVIKTTLAAEDIRFYDHTGVDLIAMGRVLLDAASGGRKRGGSTITMQLAKQLFTGNDWTVQRKMDQMAIAVQMEKLLSKDQILEQYLNHSYYGEGAYGIWAAARTYFGKDLEELTLAEAALLARCVRRPSDENPIANLKAAVNNRNVVLKIMLDEGQLSRDEYEKAVNEPVKINKNRVGKRVARKICGYFVDYVLEEAKRVLPNVDILQGGYQIQTTLNLKVQRAAEKKIARVVNDYRRISVGAEVTLDREGRIRAMVGGQDYERSEFNNAVRGQRQPGSSFKPFVYLVAAQNSIVDSPWSSVDNSQVTYKGAGGEMNTVKGGGPFREVPMIQALTYSYNRAAWHTLERVGPASVVRYAKTELGFKGHIPPVASLALGTGLVSPLELAQAYTIFPNKGRRASAFCIERILGPTGMPVYAAEPEYVKTSFSVHSIEVIDRCLRDVVVARGGTGSAASDITNARGKTGTTNDNKDAWFAGYTDDYVTVVWFSYPNPVTGPRVVYRPMGDAIMGGRVGAPAWSDVMQDVVRVLGESRRKLTWDHLSGRARDDVESEKPRHPTVDDPNGDGVVAPGEMPGNPSRDPSRDTGGSTPPPADEGAAAAQTVSVPPLNPARDHARRDPGPSPAAPGRAEASRRSDEDEYVSVSICADSGQRATVYCPERVTRRFKKGTEPKGRCPIHGP